MSSSEYSYWGYLLGRPTTDEDLKNAFNSANLGQLPILKRGEVSEAVDVGDITLSFRHPVLFGRDSEFGDGVAIFSGIGVHLFDREDGGYKGKLPFGIEKNDNQKSVLERLGDRSDADEDDCWDEWIIDSLEVTTMWSEDFKRIETLTIYVPEI